MDPAADPQIQSAAQALRRGQLVVFPTETVYGVGANALDPVAVARIFAAKGRPPDNPLIVHAADERAARDLAASWPETARRLASRFWPGPLTLVLPRAPHVPDIVTARLDTVALRVPAHPVAQALLRVTGLPVAAPSANRSGSPSPTRVEDAREDLGTSVAVYLDAGPTPVGVESTVVDLSGPHPILLRPGGLPRSAIEAVVGPLARPGRGAPARSPGLKYRHYAPRARLRIVSGAQLAAEAKTLEDEGLRVAVIAAPGRVAPGPHVRVPGGAAEAWARALYALLRDLDRQGYDAIVVEAIPEEGLGEAVMDRLRRAAEAA